MSGTTVELPVKNAPVSRQKKSEEPLIQLEEHAVNVAFDEGSPSHYSGPINLSMVIRKPHVETFRSIFNGLNKSHVVKANGKHVDHHADVVLWLMEEFAKSKKRKTT